MSTIKILKTIVLAFILIDVILIGKIIINKFKQGKVEMISKDKINIF